MIPFQWNEASGTLTFGERIGSFTGMGENRTFRVVLVGPDHGVGESVSSSVDAVIDYSGKSYKIVFPADRLYGRASSN